MFTITEQAKQYIHAHGGHVIITLTFEPSGGSCWKGDLIWGSYVPEIGLGKPGQQMDYPFELVDDIVVWYHPKLQVQQGYQSIVIHMKRFLFHQWLTIEGAQGMAITREKGFE